MPNWAGRPPDISTSSGYAETTTRMQETPMRRNRTTNRERTGSTVQVWSYNCESCLVPLRMAELLYTAKCRGADAVCLQGTQMTMETPWTHGQRHTCGANHAQSRRRSAHCSVHAKVLQGTDRDSLCLAPRAAARSQSQSWTGERRS